MALFGHKDKSTAAGHKSTTAAARRTPALPRALSRADGTDDEEDESQTHQSQTHQSDHHGFSYPACETHQPQHHEALQTQHPACELVRSNSSSSINTALCNPRELSSTNSSIDRLFIPAASKRYTATSNPNPHPNPNPACAAACMGVGGAEDTRTRARPPPARVAGSALRG